jgi:hypothetical protein
MSSLEPAQLASANVGPDRNKCNVEEKEQEGRIPSRGLRGGG